MTSEIINKILEIVQKPKESSSTFLYVLALAANCDAAYNIRDLIIIKKY